MRANFGRFGLLDDQVVFLKGWFRDTMPQVDADALAVLRLDGDMCESTIVPLVHHYDRLSPGGWVIVDDYRLITPCQEAVRDFFEDRGIDPSCTTSIGSRCSTGRKGDAHSSRRCAPVPERSTTKDTPPQWMSLKRWKCHCGLASRNSLSASRSPETPESRLYRK